MAMGETSPRPLGPIDYSGTGWTGTVQGGTRVPTGPVKNRRWVGRGLPSAGVVKCPPKNCLARPMSWARNVQRY